MVTKSTILTHDVEDNTQITEENWSTASYVDLEIVRAAIQEQTFCQLGISASVEPVSVIYLIHMHGREYNLSW